MDEETDIFGCLLGIVIVIGCAAVAIKFAILAFRWAIH